MTGSENGWLEAAIAWEVCASLHRHYCKGRDALFTTRQSDFVKHAEDARDRASRGQASTQPVEKWSDRVQRAHPKSEPEFWPDELRLKYMADEISDLRAACDPAISAEPAPIMPKGESAAPRLRAMATNYPADHLWDKLDATACIRGALEIEALRAARSPADSVLEDAARYRWLRERSSTMFVNISINGEGAEIAATLDSAVDAARKQGANHA